MQLLQRVTIINFVSLPSIKCIDCLCMLSVLFLIDHHCETQSEFFDLLEKDWIYWTSCRVISSGYSDRVEGPRNMKSMWLPSAAIFLKTFLQGPPPRSVTGDCAKHRYDGCKNLQKFRDLVILTRMHSSRMRTGRTVTVFWKLEEPPPGPDPPQKIWSRHPPSPPKIWSRHTHPSPENLEQTPPPKIWSRHPPLWTEFMTHACENITLAETSFRPVIILFNRFY